MKYKWARCKACGSEVYFDAWVTLNGDPVGIYDENLCSGCDGPVGVSGWEEAEGETEGKA